MADEGADLDASMMRCTKYVSMQVFLKVSFIYDTLAQAISIRGLYLNSTTVVQVNIRSTRYAARCERRRYL